MTARVRASSSFRRRVFERLEAVQKREREKESERGAFFCPSLFAFVSFFFLSFVFFCLSLFFHLLLFCLSSIFFVSRFFFSFSWETFTHRRRQMHKAREEKERVAHRGSRTRAVGKGGGRGGGGGGGGRR